MTGFWQDLRQALRTMWKQPGFTLVAAITLALGIGANTAIFSVINALILNPLHIADAERVVALWRTAKDKRDKGPSSYLDLQEWRAQSSSFEAIAGYKRNPFTLLGDQAEQVQGMRVTASFLSLLKVNPVLGRDFQTEEEKRGAKGVVIISHQFWQTRLGSDASAIGKDLTLDGKPFTIIGVLPRDFDLEADDRPQRAESHAEVPVLVLAVGGRGAGRLLQHLGLRGRHTGVRLHPGPARPVPPGGCGLPGPARAGTPTRPGRGRRDGRGPGLQPAAGVLRARVSPIDLIRTVFHASFRMKDAHADYASDD